MPQPPDSEGLLSPAHPRVKAVAALAQKKARDEAQLLLVEGRFPIEEALRAGLRPSALYTLERTPPPANWPASAPVFRASEAAMGKMATTDSPPPHLATFTAPARASLETAMGDRWGGAPLLLALDEIRDPGNIGALMRSAAAFGVDAVLATPRTAECLSPKVIRASAGLVFRLCVIPVEMSLPALLTTLSQRGVSIRLTRGAGSDGPPPAHYREVSYRGACAIALGNEGRGLDADDESPPGSVWTTIPMATGVDSLNVAMCGAILLAEAADQRQRGRPSS